MELTIEAVAIIFTLVGTIISIVAFGASIYFYHKGIVLQNEATKVMQSISVKADSIQTQVTGMSDKMLDALVSKRNLLEANLEDLGDDIEELRHQLVKEAAKEIGEIGEAERQRLLAIVDEQIENLKESFDSTLNTARDVVSQTVGAQYNLSTIEIDILMLIYSRIEEGKTATLSDISIDMDMGLDAVVNAVLGLESRTLVSPYAPSIGAPLTLTPKGKELAQQLIGRRQ